MEHRKMKIKRNYEENSIQYDCRLLLSRLVLTLYWVVGGFVRIIQQFVINFSSIQIAQTSC